jgi:GT2 family glycosyltransferase
MLNISIVLYHPDWQQLNSLCAGLLQVANLRSIYLIDNSPVKAEQTHIDAINSLPHRTHVPQVKYLWNNGNNLGYGAAHNIAIRHSVYERTRYHLVMNSDIKVHAEDIDRLHTFMEKNRQVGCVMPRVVYPDGQIQYLCKLLPTPFDVFGRRFLPAWLMKRRNNIYELRDSGYNRMLNVPYLSGCFLFLRTEAVLQARLFDERYFMYPEDVDLVRTIHRSWLTLFLPDITITHDHTRASYHSLRMTWIHIVNLCRYFNKWGWFFDRERRLVNRLTLEQLSSPTAS